MRRLSSWSTYIGAAGVMLCAAAVLLFLITDLARSALLFGAGIGVVMVAFYFITRPRDAVRQKSNVQIAARGVNVLLIALAVIGILGALNYIANQQFKQRIDVTANRTHTLSAQTIQVLKTLTETVNVIGFFNPATVPQRQQAEALLKNYQAQSDKLSVQYVDADENPTLAQKYDHALPGTLIFENAKADRTEKVYTFDENALTNAVLKVTQTQAPVIYFSSGHGEYVLDESDQIGLAAIADTLTQLNYQVEPLNLVTISNTLPADTRALVIAGPTKPFSAESEKLIDDYLNGGGRVLFLADPTTSVGLTDTLRAWGVGFENNLVLDPAKNYLGNAPIPVFTEFPNSPVTLYLEQFGVFFPGTRVVSDTQTADKTATALFTTTDQACVKTDIEALQGQTQVACQEGDARGPFVVGYAVENKSADAQQAARGRLIVIGNASFALNRWISNKDAAGNQQLFVNMINWLAGQEELISIPPRDPDYRPLGAMTGSEVNLIAGTSILLIPLAALLIGGILWWRKR